MKGDGRHRVVVTTEDRTAQVAMSDYGEALPHELVHFVVERAMGIRFGFWGLLAHGADLTAVMTFNARSPRTVSPPTDPLVIEHLDELLEAERLVAGLYQLGAGETLDHGVDPVQAAGIRQEIDALNALWQELAIGEVLRVSWQ